MHRCLYLPRSSTGKTQTLVSTLSQLRYEVLHTLEGQCPHRSIACTGLLFVPDHLVGKAHLLQTGRRLDLFSGEIDRSLIMKCLGNSMRGCRRGYVSTRTMGRANERRGRTLWWHRV